VPAATVDADPVDLILRFLLAALASTAVARIAAPAVVSDGGEQSAPPPPAAAASEPASPRYDRVLPFMADEALKSGHELPLPFGVALITTGLINRQIDVTDVRVGLNSPVQSVSRFVQLGSKSNVFNANLKFDAWLLPFLNVYALIGPVYNKSTSNALITVPRPGPLPGELQFEKEVTTELNGVVGGAGLTLAGGYDSFFIVADVSYIQSDLGFDNAFKGSIATVRTGWNGKAGVMPVQVWLGVGDWKTDTTVQGHVDLEGVGRLDFEADQRPHTPWMYDIGMNLTFNPRVQLVIDFGTDLSGGYLFVVGPTYRF